MRLKFKIIVSSLFLLLSLLLLTQAVNSVNAQDGKVVDNRNFDNLSVDFTVFIIAIAIGCLILLIWSLKECFCNDSDSKSKSGRDSLLYDERACSFQRKVQELDGHYGPRSVDVFKLEGKCLEEYNQKMVKITKYLDQVSTPPEQSVVHFFKPARAHLEQFEMALKDLVDDYQKSFSQIIGILDARGALVELINETLVNKKGSFIHCTNLLDDSSKFHSLPSWLLPENLKVSSMDVTLKERIHKQLTKIFASKGSIEDSDKLRLIELMSTVLETHFPKMDVCSRPFQRTLEAVRRPCRASGLKFSFSELDIEDCKEHKIDHKEHNGSHGKHSGSHGAHENSSKGLLRGTKRSKRVRLNLKKDFESCCPKHGNLSEGKIFKRRYCFSLYAALLVESMGAAYNNIEEKDYKTELGILMVQ